jgi:hypothetical protein
MKRIAGQRFDARAKSPPTQAFQIPLMRFTKRLAKVISPRPHDYQVAARTSESNPTKALLGAKCKTEGHIDGT